MSDKLNILSQNDFEKLQQSSTSSQSKIIKNSKYKKSHGTNQGLDLLSFVKERKKKPKRERKIKVKYVIGSLVVKPKFKRGKIRENGKKKKSTLKKAILRYREGKKQQIDIDIQQLSKELAQLSLPKISNETKLHSSRFKSYCDNCTTPVLAELTDNLLRTLDRFQKRAHRENPIKAHAKRRFVLGFRECLSFLGIKKAKLVIIAPDCEECPGQDGLNETINKIKTQCLEKNIPYMFSLPRRKLAYALFKKVPISCLCILDYDGANETFHKIIEALKEARKQYQELTRNEPKSMAIEQ